MLFSQLWSVLVVAFCFVMNASMFNQLSSLGSNSMSFRPAILTTSCRTGCPALDSANFSKLGPVLGRFCPKCTVGFDMSLRWMLHQFVGTCAGSDVLS